MYILLNVSYENKQYPRGTYYFRYQWIADNTGETKNAVEGCIQWLREACQITSQKATHGIIISVLNYAKYQDIKKMKTVTETVTETVTKPSQNRDRTVNIPNKKQGTSNTAGKPAISLGTETFMLEELTYEPLEAKKGKSILGRKTMVFLAYAYLEAKGIKLAQGETYDANKISKGLSKLYNEAGKDPYKTANRIKIGGEYFSSKGLDWVPETVWKRWEDIKKWHEQGRPDKPIKEVNNSIIYE